MLGRKKDRLVGPGRRRSWAIQRFTMKSWLVSCVYPQFGYIACFASCQRYTLDYNEWLTVVQYPWHLQWLPYVYSKLQHVHIIPITVPNWTHVLVSWCWAKDRNTWQSFSSKECFYFHKSSIYKGLRKPWNVLHWSGRWQWFEDLLTFYRQWLVRLQFCLWMSVTKIAVVDVICILYLWCLYISLNIAFKYAWIYVRFLPSTDTVLSKDWCAQLQGANARN